MISRSASPRFGVDNLSIPQFIAIIVIISCCGYGIHHRRFRQYAGLPQLPPSFFMGHLKVVDEFIRRMKPDSHPDAALQAMRLTCGQPEIMFVDLRPVDIPVVVVGSHHIAEQVSRPSREFIFSPPKAQKVYDHMGAMIGTHSILSLNVSTVLYKSLGHPLERPLMVRRATNGGPSEDDTILVSRPRICSTSSP